MEFTISTRRERRGLPPPYKGHYLDDVSFPSSRLRGSASAAFQIGISLFGAPRIESTRFLERREHMAAMEKFFFGTSQNNRQLRLVLQGARGMGKTQLAIKFAEANAHRLSSVYFLDCQCRMSVVRSMEMAMNRVWDHEAKIAGDQPTEKVKRVSGSENCAQAFVNWLSLSSNKRWLLICDNYDNTDDCGYELLEFVPKVEQGRILITTRSLPASFSEAVMEIVPLTPPEAHALLEKYLRREDESLPPYPVVPDEGRQTLQEIMSGRLTLIPCHAMYGFSD
jgi:hypothetical protein